MDIFIGIFIGIVGFTVAFSGLRVFFAMLPLLGFITGLFAGATLIQSWLGEGFLASLTGWLVGIVLGILFALVSYLWWYAGALLAAGASGALLASGLFSLFGVNSGVFLTIVAMIGAVVFIFLAMALNLPVYIVLVNTAILGAYGVIGGLLLIFNVKDLNEFDWGVARAIAHENWFWWIVWVVIVVAGIMSQMKIINQIRFPEDRWVKAEPA